MLEEIFLKLLTLSLVINVGLAIISFALVLVITIIISKTISLQPDRDTVFLKSLIW